MCGKGGGGAARRRAHIGLGERHAGAAPDEALGTVEMSRESKMVQLGGLEPPTSGATIRRSNQLSYSCTTKTAADMSDASVVGV
jgi:hypothetical protein